MPGYEKSEEYLARIVDTSVLANYLRERLGPADTYSVEHLGAGHSNETLRVTWGDTDLVLRRPPPGEVASSAHDVLREYRVIDALQDSRVRVPPTIDSCDDTSIIGSEFFLMKMVDGDVIRRQLPERFGTTATKRGLGTELVDRLVDVHSVDYRAVGLEDFGHPDGYTERQVDRWTKQFEWATSVTASEREVSGVRTVTDWLSANVPDETRDTLVHGDYKVDNVMFSPGTPPRIACIFDWELSTLGNPLTDLGWMLTFWWDEKDPDAPASTGNLYPTFMRDSEFPTRLELVDRYEKATGHVFDDDVFYRVLGVFKLAALGEMFYRRHLEGNSDDPLYPEMEEGVPNLVDRAHRIIDGEEPL